MARSYNFAVVKIAPDALRDEALNAAVVVLKPDCLDVRVTENPERLRTIAPALTSEALDDLALALKNVDPMGESISDRLAALRRVPGLQISEPAVVQGENESELNANIAELVVRLLGPVRSTLIRPAVKATALARDISKIFVREKLMGRGEDAINQHKIVRNWSLTSDGSIKADFVAKNSAFHVTETVDLRTAGELSTSRLKDIAVAAVTLDEAKRKLGRTTQRYLVYAATSSEEQRAGGFLNIAAHHAEHVFNFASRDDRSHYLDFIFSALRGDLAVKRVKGGKLPSRAATRKRVLTISSARKRK